MWDWIAEGLFDFLPVKVQIGCLAVGLATFVGLLLWVDW